MRTNDEHIHAVNMGKERIDWSRLVYQLHEKAPWSSFMHTWMYQSREGIRFNRENTKLFFTKLSEILERYNFQAKDICNVDESGISTAQKPRTIVAPKGTKQVGVITSAKRGQTVTLCEAISAVGTFVPPMFVFPRVHFKDHFIRDGPPGCCGAAHLSGWMVAELFVIFLHHFVAHVRPSKDNPVLLLLDNHAPHLGTQGLDYAKANGVIMLSFPPHCSHKLQPLDCSVFGPLKKIVSTAEDGWVRSNPGKTMVIYDLPGIVRTAWPIAAKPVNIIKGFQATGIYPLHPDIFTDADYAPSMVTDREIPDTEGNGSTVDITAASPMSEIRNQSEDTNTANVEDLTTSIVGAEDIDVADEVEVPLSPASPATREPNQGFDDQTLHSANASVSPAPTNPPSGENDTGMLGRRLNEKGLYVIPVPRDGHCLLHTFRLCLHKGEIADVSDDLCTRTGFFISHSLPKDRIFLRETHRYITLKEYDRDTVDMLTHVLCNAMSVKASILQYTNGRLAELQQGPEYAKETINLVLTGSEGNEHYDAAVACGVVGGSEVGIPCHNARQVSVESLDHCLRLPRGKLVDLEELARRQSLLIHQRKMLSLRNSPKRREILNQKHQREILNHKHQREILNHKHQREILNHKHQKHHQKTNKQKHQLSEDLPRRRNHQTNGN